jgi:hypothetical protein
MTRSGKWLEKIPEWGLLIKDVYKLFTTYRSFEKVRRIINERYQSLLPKPLRRDQIRKMLTDPIYVGRPQHLGEIVLDASLAFVSEEEFGKVQGIVNQIGEKHNAKKLRVVRHLVQTYGISALQFLEKVELHHATCGGQIKWNGTRKDSGIEQDAAQCARCGAQFRVPTVRELKRIQSLRDNAPGELRQAGPSSADSGTGPREKGRSKRNMPDPSQRKMSDF